MFVTLDVDNIRCGRGLPFVRDTTDIVGFPDQTYLPGLLSEGFHLVALSYVFVSLVVAEAHYCVHPNRCNSLLTVSIRSFVEYIKEVALR